MDSDEELRNLKRMATAGILFLMSAYFSWTELKYVVSGKVTEADLVNVARQTRRGKYGSTKEYLSFEYQFNDAGNTRRESDEVSTDTQQPSNGKVSVQYLPGTTSSRLEGHRQTFYVVLFFISIGWAGWEIYQLAKEANTPIRSPRRRRP